jgi:hypothetical protein
MSHNNERTNRHLALILILAITCNVLLAAISPKVNIWESEIGRIAASIASDRGFSSPFRRASGPSAWIPPLYPYILAGIFYVFGVYTSAAYRIAVSINILAHALTSVILYGAARRTFGERVGRLSAYSLATFPLLFYPLVLTRLLGGYGGGGLFIKPNLIWYTHLSELAIVMLIWLTLNSPHWVVYGAAWGFAALLNPTILALAPAFLMWQAYYKQGLRYVSMVAFVALLCVTPWLYRNYSVFHRPVFIRDNLGVELRVGNQPGQNGLWDAELHPDRSDLELDRLIKMGEAEYARDCGQQAVRTILIRPGEFLWNVVLRTGYWWIGNPMTSKRLGSFRFLKYLPQVIFSLLALLGAALVVQQKNTPGLLFVSVLIFYPLIYYVTHTFGGFFYQYPIHPEMLALAVSWVLRKNMG